MQFIIVTRDFAGLGLATRLQDEGHQVILAVNEREGAVEQESFRLVGDGLVPKQPLASVLQTHTENHDIFWFGMEITV